MFGRTVRRSSGSRTQYLVLYSLPAQRFTGTPTFSICSSRAVSGVQASFPPMCRARSFPPKTPTTSFVSPHIELRPPRISICSTVVKKNIVPSSLPLLLTAPPTLPATASAPSFQPLLPYLLLPATPMPALARSLPPSPIIFEPFVPSSPFLPRWSLFSHILRWPHSLPSFPSLPPGLGPPIRSSCTSIVSSRVHPSSPPPPPSPPYVIYLVYIYIYT